MDKKTLSLISIGVVVLFVLYIIFDTVRPYRDSASQSATDLNTVSTDDEWYPAETIYTGKSRLNAVAVNAAGVVYLGTDSGLAYLDNKRNIRWIMPTELPVRALAASNDTLFAALKETIIVVTAEGRVTETWGPFEAGSLFTSVSVNDGCLVIADAGAKRIFILNKKGEVRSMIGQGDHKFIVPSPYFDVALTPGNELFIANTGKHRIERWTTDGKLLGSFGEAGTAPEAFCGCCNPAHFTHFGNGFVTAEKGINRIKVLNADGDFDGFVTSKNDFIASVPLDIAVSGDSLIYAANPQEAKLYVYRRIKNN